MALEKYCFVVGAPFCFLSGQRIYQQQSFYLARALSHRWESADRDDDKFYCLCERILLGETDSLSYRKSVFAVAWVGLCISNPKVLPRGREIDS